MYFSLLAEVSSRIPQSLIKFYPSVLSTNMAKKRSKPKVKKEQHGKPSQKQFNDVQKKSSSFFTAMIAILGIARS